MFNDSTFKSNNESLKLFLIIASCIGIGFLLCYFLLESSTKGVHKSRKESLAIFLQSLKNNVPTKSKTSLLLYEQG